MCVVVSKIEKNHSYNFLFYGKKDNAMGDIIEPCDTPVVRAIGLLNSAGATALAQITV